MITLLEGDCLEQLRTLPANSVDALVTDPPAGIAFMGAEWDRDKGGRATWVAWMAGVMAECRRVLKPGAHGLVWALPRTSHWTATALEDAGFEVRDVITHHFGTGFPKSLDVSKALDKRAGAERAIVSEWRTGRTGTLGGKSTYAGIPGADVRRVTAPATDAARQWQGWGTALKPASEHWILVRKPLAAANVAANVVAYGTGAIHIDAGRVGTRANAPQYRPASPSGAGNGGTCYSARDGQAATYSAGRWPANVVLSHSADCVPAGTYPVPSNARRSKARPGSDAVGYDGGWQPETRAWGSEGAETVEAWVCAEGCPVAELDAQSGKLTSGAKLTSHNRTAPRLGRGAGFGGGEWSQGETRDYAADTGGASRFFPTFRYAAKASPRERSLGCDALARNTHPTVKSQALMRWLLTLITPPGGIVLDCFMGSGSTGVAAVAGGFGFIGIERDPEYFAIAQARVSANERTSAADPAKDVH